MFWWTWRRTCFGVLVFVMLFLANSPVHGRDSYVFAGLVVFLLVFLAEDVLRLVEEVLRVGIKKPALCGGGSLGSVLLVGVTSNN